MNIKFNKTQQLLILSLISMTFFWSQEANAQNTKSIQLKPIYKSGMRYYYDSKKVNSAFSLEIPLLALNDEDINKRYKQFKTLQSLRGLAYLPSMIWIFTANTSSANYYDTFIYLFLGGLVADVGINALSHQKMNQAIELYNIAIMDRSAIGFNLQNIQHQQFSVNVGYKYQLN